MYITNEELCEVCEIPEEKIIKAQNSMPEEEALFDLAELYKVFGDSTRVKILFILAETEMCVCDIAAALNMTHSAISHQLRILKQSRLVKNRREGKTIYYSLKDTHVEKILNQGLEHIYE